MRADENSKGSVNYEPNSFDGPIESESAKRSIYRIEGFADSSRHEKHSEDNDFVQAGNLYRIMSDDQKKILADNIAGELKLVRRDIVERQLEQFYQADRDYGARIADRLGVKLATH